MSKILVIEDDNILNKTMCEFLNKFNYKTICAMRGLEGLDLAKKELPDLVILDLRLPDVNGMDLIERLKKFTEEIIIITAHGDVADAVKAIKLGVYNFLEKPVDLKVLINEVNRSLETVNLKKEIEKLKQKLNNIPELIGKSRFVEQIKEKINLIANKNIPILITGESGTGKEVVAQAIYKISNSKKFIAVNCGAIPPELFESELFGYEKGAFTGADHSKQGKFELADNGTLFLDEIGELPKNMQVKLLRVLETKEVERIGSTKPKKVNVRIIAATNRNLKKMVDDGEFREDLYFRLSVFQINVEPLRKHREDIPLLVNYFIHKANEEFNTMIKGINPDALDILIKYNWPGNVRELKNVIYSMVAISTSDILDKTLIPENIKESENLEYIKIPLGLQLEEAEKRYIIKTLEFTKNNKTQAANILGITKMTLFSKLKKWKIN
ncbi:two-component system, NtrC family, response regulator HydG [Marinitoga hydrogenitolerans DSM 16785]|uniref:Two-component system, NtrC family, response regulator HydG n=1 Tax=Marinitoga hydrogenitolerans (strain DSM 16785 / JCM 12826 / AT1271) TaxID=1122195 RepID=A0A1M4Z8Z0_MARH1|nr:sigma-54 dependent transcriptional regulator [Marinitoga hydrogenitolerans]SHF14500.1 two-component system, NtrC family, response regulator HydG [Marinitoga hydrogenitolerans DSM 16785]